MSYQNILVAVDDSPISYAAVEHALSLAKLSGAKVTVLSVVAVDPYVGVISIQLHPQLQSILCKQRRMLKHSCKI